MIAFVTGGTGFIGSHLVDLLQSIPGNEVRCLVRSQEKWLTGKKYIRISGDLHDLDALKKGCREADVVFHLAGAVKAKNLAGFVRENVEGTENVVRIAQKAGVKHIVVLSSFAAAGPSKGVPAREGDVCSPVSSYGESKRQMEESLKGIVAPQTHLAVIRPPAVYGPREENILPLFKSMKKGYCPVIGKSGQTSVSMIYVKDLVQGIVLAGSQSPEGLETYFMADEGAYSWREIADATAFVLQRKVKTVHVSPSLVSAAGSLFEKVGKISGRTAFFDREKAIEVTSEWICSIQKAKTQLGFNPSTGLIQGISETLRWYTAHHWL